MRKRETKRAKELKGALKLPFLLAKILTIIYYLISTQVYAQHDCRIRLHVETSPAQCQADGEIRCTLSDTSGQQLEQIRYSYIPVLGIDSILESTQSHISQFRPGRYTVIVSALCHTGLEYGDAYAIVSDTARNVTVESSYNIPSNGVQTNIHTKERPYGIVPSLRCHPTGKVQLVIKNGTFPYTVDIWSTTPYDTTFLRSIVFDSPQHNGDDPNRSDYRYYFTIDSLASGTYKLSCHDGCGYYMPLLYTAVPEASLTTDVHDFLLRNSSGDISSYNIIVFKDSIRADLLMNNTSYYYYINEDSPTLEYRFINPTLGTDKDTTTWRPLPNIPSNQVLYLRDTVTAASSYGEIWMKEITLQYRSRICPDTTWSSTFTIYPQGKNLRLESSTINRTTQSNWFDYCYYYRVSKTGFQVNNLVQFIHNMSDGYVGLVDSLNQTNHKFYTESGGIHSVEEGMSYHSYITLPLICNIYDNTAHEIAMRDTIPQPGTYHWLVNYYKESQRNGHELIVEITDFKGSPLYADSFISNLDTTFYQGDTSRTVYRWYKFSGNENYCSDSKRSVGVYLVSTEYKVDGVNYAYYGDTIRLIKSPRDNLYNLTAYADAYQHFVVQKEHLGNLSEVGYYRNFAFNSSVAYPSLRLSDNRLPSGRYVWVIDHACHCSRPSDTIVQDIVFPESPDIVETPSYEFIPGCTQLKIVPITGQYSNGGVNTETFFQAYRGNHLEHSFNSVHLGDTITIGTPGTYVLCMYALPKNNAELVYGSPCYQTDTIIEWDARTIEFDYLISYVCDERDSVGFVRCRGKHGIPPRTYTLYDAPNGTGNILAQNTTGDFNDLPIHFGQALSVDMRDSCQAHFIENFIVSDMEHIRKAWMEEAVSSAILSEGDTCHLFSISMGDVLYHWSGPDHYQHDTQNPLFVIPHNGQASGYYYVAIEGSGCPLVRDSVLLIVQDAPHVRLERDTTVCPGEIVSVVASAEYSRDITYSIVKETFSERDTLVFDQRSNGQRDTLRTVINENTRFYVCDVRDESHVYNIFSDTVHASIRSDLSDIHLAVAHDTVCRGGDATLTAYSDVLPPYTLYWQNISDNSLIQTDHLLAYGEHATLHLDNIERDTAVLVTITTTATCPPGDGIYGNILMHDGEVTIPSGEGYRFFDSGGPWSGYSDAEEHILTLRASDSTSSLTLQFERFNCSGVAGGNSDVLFIFDGDTVSEEPGLTLRGELTAGTLPTFTAHSGAITCWFIANHLSTSEGPDTSHGWRAIVRNEASRTSEMHIAHRTAHITVKGDASDTTLYKEVEFSELPYLWNGVSFEHADSATLHTNNRAGCDSLVHLVLTVKPSRVCPNAIDYDGNEYAAVRIGSYCWTQRNLQSEHYSDGREIATRMGYFAEEYPDTASNVATFGSLYTWEAAMDTVTHTLLPSGHRQGICPEGWYLPTIEQYEELISLGMPALRSPLYWITGEGHNSSGFTALPAGYYCGVHQRFENLMGETYFWADYDLESSEKSIAFHTFLSCDQLKKENFDKANGFSIRCILEE